MMRQLFTFLLFWISQSGFSQVEKTTDSPQNFRENLIIETKWQYAYTIHLESGTVVHQAEDNYAHFLYFKYDYSFLQFLNGVVTDGIWSLKNDQLEWPFRKQKSFQLSNLTDLSLDLEFAQPSAKGTWVYHFNRVESKDAPFLKPLNELPEVRIEAENPKLLQRVFAKKQDKWWQIGRKNAEKPQKEAEIYISVELNGGGYYGGLDPVQRDYVVIKNDGRLIKEFKSQNRNLMITKKNITREELERFAKWAVEQKFFDCSREYDCKAAFCEKRKNMRPEPMPLRICIAYGNVRKMVTISIYGFDDKGVKYVDYPPELDHIIEAIQRMASRLES
jgi:hypothetical protein